MVVVLGVIISRVGKGGTARLTAVWNWPGVMKGVEAVVTNVSVGMERAGMIYLRVSISPEKAVSVKY